MHKSFKYLPVGPRIFCSGLSAWDRIHELVRGFVFTRMKRIFHFRSPSRSSLGSSNGYSSGFRGLGSPGQLGPLEQRLLEALWSRGTATVRELLEHGIEDLAYTTVMTTLDRLFKKNLLAREVEGRAFRYAPRFTREELHREVAGEAFRQLLDSSPGTELPLSYLVEILSERDAQLLEDLRQVVESKRRDLRKNELRKNDVRKNDVRKKTGDAGGQEKH